MKKPVKYNGILTNSITQEQAPCVIVGEVYNYHGNNKKYLRLRKVPRASFLNSHMDGKDNHPEHNFVWFPQLQARAKHLPMILHNTETNEKLAVHLVSLAHIAEKHFNITVSISTNGLDFCNELTSRMITLDERKQRISSHRTITTAASVQIIRPHWRNGDITSLMRNGIEYRHDQIPFPDYAVSEYKERFIQYGATEDEATELVWAMEAKVKYQHEQTNA